MESCHRKLVQLLLLRCCHAGDGRALGRNMRRGSWWVKVLLLMSLRPCSGLLASQVLHVISCVLSHWCAHMDSRFLDAGFYLREELKHPMSGVCRLQPDVMVLLCIKAGSAQPVQLAPCLWTASGKCHILHSHIPELPQSQVTQAK
jgi:hypothetical protein